MTDGRYDSRRGTSQTRGRSFDQYDRSGRDDRGFLDRARDEVSSWFGDDDAERRRDMDARSDDGRFGRERERGYDSFEQGGRHRDDNYRRPYTGRSGAASGPGDSYERNPTSQNFDRGNSPRDFGRPSGGLMNSGRHDSDYSQWRSRQIDELDRDYDEFRRENQSRFDSEFSTWRGQRQTKRQLIGTVAEQMEVVGSDELPVGKVDHVRGDRIILTKSDSIDGRHHPISCTLVDRVEDGRVILNRTADETKRQFDSAARDRGMFERDDQIDDGPHMLNRSFSGTY